MTYKCKGICTGFISPNAVSYKYPNGFKRCSICVGFFKILGIRCPCCGAKLRTKRRSGIKKVLVPSI